jgi:type II secretory pathway predicted ATPase ExeA
MYERFYDLREKPFSLLPDPDFLYLGDKHSMALAMLQYGLMNQAGFTVITGGIGCGKTTLIRQLLNQMETDITVGLISNTHRSFGELLEQILLAFRVDFKDKTKAELYQSFVDFLIDNYGKNCRTVLIVDEAQNMEADTLEELRLLSNVNADKCQVLQLILVGQPELWEELRRPELEQFAQRIGVDYYLEPLELKEVGEYIRHRLTVAGGNPDLFETEAIQIIYEYSQGTPRLINTLCDTALVYGYAKQKRTIGAELMLKVAQDKSRGGIFAANQARKPVFRPVTEKVVEEIADPAAVASQGPEAPELGAPLNTGPAQAPQPEAAGRKKGKKHPAKHDTPAPRKDKTQNVARALFGWQPRES